MKLSVVLALFTTLFASVSGFAPLPRVWGSKLIVGSGGEGEPKLGSGGMADTRDPEEMTHEDPRKSISAAPSFEEYLKQREAEGN